MLSLHAPELVRVFVAENIAVLLLEEVGEHNIARKRDRTNSAEASLIGSLLTAVVGALRTVPDHGRPIETDHRTRSADGVEDALHSPAFLRCHSLACLRCAPSSRTSPVCYTVCSNIVMWKMRSVVISLQILLVTVVSSGIILDQGFMVSSHCSLRANRAVAYNNSTTARDDTVDLIHTQLISSSSMSSIVTIDRRYTTTTACVCRPSSIPLHCLCPPTSSKNCTRIDRYTVLDIYTSHLLSSIDRSTCSPADAFTKLLSNIALVSVITLK
jgi:hypothetical protein